MVQVGATSRSWGSAVPSAAWIRSSALELLTELGRGFGGLCSERACGDGRGPAPILKNRRAVARTRFRLHQSMYADSKGALADLRLDGLGKTLCPIPLPEVTAVFSSRWGGVEVFGGLCQFAVSGHVSNEFFWAPISASEVGENLQRVKHSTASGPDGVTKSDLVKWDPSGCRLARLFNTWFVSGTLPDVFKMNTSTLIPKSADPAELELICNWRPITVGSVVRRLNSRILTLRMAAACPLSPRQKGFTCSSGYSENLMVLEGLIRRSRMSGVTLALVSVDFAKAFDTVTHEHILGALERKGLDEHVLGLIRDSYVDCVTRVKVEAGRSPLIGMKVGVKQGDPMSPLLFNLALDPLIQTLECRGEGYSWNGQSVTTFAFADDLVMVSGSWNGMAKNIAILETFCQLTGVCACNPRSALDSCSPRGHTRPWENDCRPWLVCGESLRLTGSEVLERYLGMQLGPDTAIGFSDPVLRTQEWVDRIGRVSWKCWSYA